jgi:hypothetical protein
VGASVDLDRVGVDPDAETARLAAHGDRAGRPLHGDDHVQLRAFGRRRQAADRAEDQDLGAFEIRVIEIASRLSPATTVSATASAANASPRREDQDRADQCAPPAAQRIKLRRHDQQVEGQLAADRQHHDRQQDAQLLGLEVGAKPRADLRAHDAADQKQDRQDHVHGEVRRGVHQRGETGDEDDLEQRRAHHDLRRHAQEVDHRGHHDEAAAHAHDGGQDAHEEAHQQRRDDRDIEPRGPEPHLERQRVDPCPLLARGRGRVGVRPRPADRAQAFDEHQLPMMPRNTT